MQSKTHSSPQGEGEEGGRGRGGWARERRVGEGEEINKKDTQQHLWTTKSKM